jgi:uncharacterized protein (TIGR03435 family)
MEHHCGGMRERRWSLLLAIVAVLGIFQGGSGVTAQPLGSTPPEAEFDVASIRPIPSDRPVGPVSLQPLIYETMWRHERPLPGGRLRMPGMSLRLLIQVAHDVKTSQVIGGPDWVDSTRYDIEAIASGVTTHDQMRPMLRTLLSDRFKLILKRDTRTLPVFELLPTKSGLKIAPMKEGACITLTPDSLPPKISMPPAAMPNVCGWVRRVFLTRPPASVERIEGVGIPMADLVSFLSPDVDRLIIDRTGFKERFTFQLDFASSALSADLSTDSRAAASLFEALKEQLGLELRRSNVPVDVHVITSVERPSEN